MITIVQLYQAYNVTIPTRRKHVYREAVRPGEFDKGKRNAAKCGIQLFRMKRGSFLLFYGQKMRISSYRSKRSYLSPQAGFGVKAR